MSRERGLALVSVLWGVAILSLIAAAMLSASLTTAQIGHNSWSAARAGSIADAAVNQAILSLLDDRAQPRVDGTSSTSAFDGVPVRLVDTAGIRAHAGTLEAAGIERTRRALAAARIVVVVIDASKPLAPEARALLDETQGRDRVVFANKSDLGDIAMRDLAEADAIRGSVYDSATLTTLRRDGSPHVVAVGATLDVPGGLIRVISSRRAAHVRHVLGGQDRVAARIVRCAQQKKPRKILAVAFNGPAQNPRAINLRGHR